MNYRESTARGEDIVVNNHFSFPILIDYNGTICLRVFLDPEDMEQRRYPSVQTRYCDSNHRELGYLKSTLRELLLDPSNCQRVRLKRDSILIVNKILCLHGRARLKNKSQRLFHRTQLIKSL